MAAWKARKALPARILRACRLELNACGNVVWPGLSSFESQYPCQITNIKLSGPGAHSRECQKATMHHKAALFRSISCRQLSGCTCLPASPVPAGNSRLAARARPPCSVGNSKVAFPQLQAATSEGDTHVLSVRDHRRRQTRSALRSHSDYLLSGTAKMRNFDITLGSPMTTVVFDMTFIRGDWLWAKKPASLCAPRLASQNDRESRCRTKAKTSLVGARCTSEEQPALFVEVPSGAGRVHVGDYCRALSSGRRERIGEHDGPMWIITGRLKGAAASLRAAALRDRCCRPRFLDTAL